MTRQLDELCTVMSLGPDPTREQLAIQASQLITTQLTVANSLRQAGKRTAKLRGQIARAKELRDTLEVYSWDCVPVDAGV